MKVTFLGPDVDGGGVAGRYRRGKVVVAAGDTHLVDACPLLAESLSGVDKSRTRSLQSTGPNTSASMALNVSTTDSRELVVSTLLLRDVTRSGRSLQKEDDSELGGREITPSASS